ncbi:hypothetical protein M407DRAFT_30114 [Tulasnella calospora MUT 4182]|uniref:Glycoside hydrolase family 16 protein n=1 Tax=Tulasnella calospora MUT 4182 TaxID=1051891 RepID=A0A0C3Q8S6_9AGAM|nr:hypothetical protein M407DRAFT_30114 [Tulasnella calospora MUT 4182]
MSILGGVTASQTIFVEAQDERISYDSTAITGPAWELVPPSADACDTPQMLSNRQGDYLSFTFTGIGVSVIGTKGVRQGLIDFYVDGIWNTTVDRGRPQLMCDEVLFEMSDLYKQEHTIIGMLGGLGINPETGEEDGVSPVQRLKYTAPDDPQ